MSKKSSTTITFSRSTDSILRGLAIIEVVGIHILSSLKPSPFWPGMSSQWWSVTLDQLFRLCVPLFVALSGYSLMQKYSKNTFSLVNFFQRRVFKIFPPYALWSLIFWIVFWLIPAWTPVGVTRNYFVQLLTGSADYHLYFVPMIFQLYLLFPLLLLLMKRAPHALFVAAGIFQIGLYTYFSRLPNVIDTHIFFQTDQRQYIVFISWIFYFVLGMYLPQIHTWMAKHWTRPVLSFMLMMVGAAVAVGSAMWSINHHVDPLIALRFTRLPILIYATTMIIGLPWFVEKLSPSPITKLFNWLGEKSYLIYLSHTLVLRILFSL